MIVAIIQARMGSTRLPGKVMKLLGDKSVLAHVITRVKACDQIHMVVVATSTSHRDDTIAREAKRWGAGIFRGSEKDVLDRYRNAALKFGAESVVRITSDCPLIDPALMKDMLLEYKRLRSTGQPLDYLSNGLHRTYPRGLDTEIFSIDALEDAWKNAHLDYQREHVTPYIYEQPKQFFLRNYASTSDWSQYRWTLDTPEDWEVISAMYRDLYDPDQEYFSTEQALAWVRDHAAKAMINAHIPQKPIAIQ